MPGAIQRQNVIMYRDPNSVPAGYLRSALLKDDLGGNAGNFQVQQDDGSWALISNVQMGPNPGDWDYFNG